MMMDSFWRTRRSMFIKSQLPGVCVPGVIDWCCNEADIAHVAVKVMTA